MSFLEAVRDAQHAREKGFGRGEQKQAYDSAMGTLQSLAAAAKIHTELVNSRSNGVPKDISEEAATTLAIESWVSLLAYYVDGFLFDTLTTSPANTESASAATVRLETERPEDVVRLRQLLAETGAPPATQPAAGLPPTTSDDSLRAKAVGLRPPMNVPIRATIELLLVRNQEGWRVSGVRFGAGSSPSVPRPTPPSPVQHPAVPSVQPLAPSQPTVPAPSQAPRAATATGCVAAAADSCLRRRPAPRSLLPASPDRSHSCTVAAQPRARREAAPPF